MSHVRSKADGLNKYNDCGGEPANNYRADHERTKTKEKLKWLIKRTLHRHGRSGLIPFTILRRTSHLKDNGLPTHSLFCLWISVRSTTRFLIFEDRQCWYCLAIGKSRGYKTTPSRMSFLILVPSTGTHMCMCCNGESWISVFVWKYVCMDAKNLTPRFVWSDEAGLG